MGRKWYDYETKKAIQAERGKKGYRKYENKNKKMKNLLGDLIKATIEFVVLPIQIVKDVVDVTIGDEPENTSQAVERILDDIFES